MQTHTLVIRCWCDFSRVAPCPCTGGCERPNLPGHDCGSQGATCQGQLPWSNGHSRHQLDAPAQCTVPDTSRGCQCCCCQSRCCCSSWPSAERSAMHDLLLLAQQIQHLSLLPGKACSHHMACQRKSCNCKPASVLIRMLADAAGGKKRGVLAAFGGEEEEDKPKRRLIPLQYT